MTSEEARAWLVSVFMEHRVQELVAIYGDSECRALVEALGQGHEVWTQNDERVSAPEQFDVLLWSGVWPGEKIIRAAMGSLRPGGLLAGYTRCSEEEHGQQIETALKNLTAPVHEAQILRQGDFFFWRALKPPLPGLTVAFFCDARGNETLPEAIASIRDYADDVLVCDTGRGDAERPHLDCPDLGLLGVKMFARPWSDDFAAAANAIRYKASREWVQVLGDDCQIMGAERLRKVIDDAESECYAVQMYHGLAMPEWTPEDITGWILPPPRTFRNRWWIFFSGYVHEQVMSAMGVAGKPCEEHCLVLPQEEAYVLHLCVRPGQDDEKQFDYQDLLCAKGDETCTALETNAMAQKFDESVYGSPAQSARVDAIVKACEGSVLDLGSGDGWILARIRDAGHEVQGVEYSRIRARRCFEHYGIKPLPHDVTEPLPFDDESFDTVAACEILEHLDNPGPTLAEMVRVARKRLIISVPICELFDRDLLHKWGIRARVICEAGVPQMLLLVCDKINRGDNDAPETS